MCTKTVLLCLVLTAPASAGTIAPGFDTIKMDRTDDGATAAIPLGFTADFFGKTYNSVYVSNNGYVTFSSPQTAFTPLGLGAQYAGQPVIAPFFADVDTRNPLSGVTSYGGSTTGRPRFGVTWPGVGYFSDAADKLNTFQLILTGRGDLGAGDFDITFNYGSIQWETGFANGGVAGLGGSSASAGFNAVAGPGSYTTLPGSLVPGAFLDGGVNALATGTNDGVPGQFTFAVRNGLLADTIPVPEPATLSLMLAGLAALAARRPS